MEIRKVRLNDIEQLQQIARSTFYETFSAVNTEADMKNYLDNNLSVAKLTEEVSNAGSQFYFAVADEEVVGYLKINTVQAQTELKDLQALEIERIYVSSAYHGQKVGQLLYQKAIDTAIERKASYVWLGVWEENARAIRFYAKNGFTPFDKHIFKLGDDEQTDILMKKHI